VGGGRDATEELPGLGASRRDAQRRDAQGRDDLPWNARSPGARPSGVPRGQPAGGPRGPAAADDTVIDAFTPIRRVPGDQDRRPGGDNGTASGQGAREQGAREQGADDQDPDDKGAGGGRHRAKRGRKPRRRRNFLTELVVLVAIAITLALVIKTYVVQAFYIPSGSMQNTLEIGDRVLINKLVYHTRGITRGDIVVFDGDGSWDFGTASGPSNLLVRFWNDLEGVFGESTGDIYIKRVIGLPGDHVACCNTAGQVTVNGVALTEQSYLYPGNPPSQQKFSIVVPPGRLWVMGDHRDVSYDSRGHMGDPGGGTIPESAVLGRAFVIIWPPSRWGILNIPVTFEQPTLTSSAAAAGGSPAALRAGTPVRQSWTPLPLALGFAGAVPLSWLQRRARCHARRRVARWRGRPHG
jgi:signal peptidase I